MIGFLSWRKHLPAKFFIGLAEPSAAAVAADKAVDNRWLVLIERQRARDK